MSTDRMHGHRDDHDPTTGAPKPGKVKQWLRRHLPGHAYPKPRWAGDSQPGDTERAEAWARWLDNERSS